MKWHSVDCSISQRNFAGQSDYSQENITGVHFIIVSGYSNENITGVLFIIVIYVVCLYLKG